MVVGSRFAGKGAFVTGAGQGIGRAIALGLAHEGARVVVADRDAEGAAAVVRDIEQAGGHAHAIVRDLETADGASAFVAQAVDMLGGVDVAVHNVGGTIWSKPFWRYERHEIEREIAHSLWPTLWGCHAILPHMRARGTGAIVNIGSLAVRLVYRVPYAAAKAAIHAVTVCLAQELGDCGVRVNCVAPGGIDVGPRRVARNPHGLSDEEREWKRDMTARTVAATPLGRYGTAEEVASAVCYLASDEASYITGQVLYVAGGGHG
jgi:dihydroxycyclohexadiene carboxylate dehydrogenase